MGHYLAVIPILVFPNGVFFFFCLFVECLLPKKIFKKKKRLERQKAKGKRRESGHNVLEGGERGKPCDVVPGLLGNPRRGWIRRLLCAVQHCRPLQEERPLLVHDLPGRQKNLRKNLFNICIHPFSVPPPPPFIHQVKTHPSLHPSIHTYKERLAFKK